MKPWLKRIIIAVVVFELAYLALGNLALQWPVTQTLLNKIRPDKFEVTWEEAWTWYPFRVHARGVSANGQSRRQQWQLELPEGAASIALLPLILKRVHLYDIDGSNVQYFQRPRLRPDNDYADTRAFFPPISNRELNNAEPLPQGKRPWTISVSNARVSGRHTVWLYQVNSTFTGEVQADIRYRTRGGPFSLSNGKASVVADSVFINGEQDAIRQVRLNGNVEFTEFVPRENKGRKALPYLTLHTDVSAEVDSLAFLNLYLQHFDGMRVDGRGRVEGRVDFETGTLLPNTSLAVSAPGLSLDLLDHRAEGSGDISLVVAAETPNVMRAAIRFKELVAMRTGDARPLFNGDGLFVEAKSDTALFPLDGARPHASYLAVTVPAVTVPDLAVYQHYIPEHLGLHLYAGEGTLHGKCVVDRATLNADLKLDSSDADVGIKDYRFTADVDVALLTASPGDGSDGLDVGGSYVRLTDARLASKEKGKSETWQASVEVDEGLLSFNLKEAVEDRGLLRAVNGQDARTLLDAADGKLLMSGHVSRLGWLNQLMKNDYQAEITGHGDLQATLLLKSGWPAAGTRLQLLQNQLAVKVLDYVAEGQGSVKLNLEAGGQRPDAHVEVLLENAFFKRQQEDKAFIEGVDLQLQALVKDMTFNGPGEDLTLHLRIPAAKVTDMRVYNLYLPENSPLQFLGGEADLVADIELQPHSARGYVTLKTDKLRSRLDEQQVSGDVTANINIAGGTPKNMAFDISGSTLLLDNIRVIGNQEKLEESDWHARVSFTRANTVWKKPVLLKAEADIEMQDSTPIVAMLSNHRNKNGWIEKMLTVGKIEGEAQVDMQKNQILFPYAFAGSDEIDVGARGVITEQTRDGVIFARYRKLKGLLKIRDGKRSFDVIKAQQKFDDYSPEALIK
ncbi:MAG: hypothetical protein WBN95_07545 [Gammaproteobacteria bacterium]